MRRLAADENFNNDVLRGLRRRGLHVDVVRVQDVGLSGAPDPAILRWAAREVRLLLTHDLATMTVHAYRLVADGEAMAGVLQVPRSLPMARVLDDLQIVVECGRPDDWAGVVRYRPL